MVKKVILTPNPYRDGGFKTVLAAQKILNDLSKLIDEARATTDKAVRAELYQEAMGYILDLAIELPVYQRDVLYAFNSKIINADSVESDVNPYSSPLDRIWEIEFAK